MSFSLFAQVFGEGLKFMGDIHKTMATRDSARAKMAALEKEKTWNIGVMDEQADTLYERSLLSSWGAGINPMTGSTAAIISQNDTRLRDEAAFRSDQYDTEINNLRPFSKARFLGIF